MRFPRPFSVSLPSMAVSTALAAFVPLLLLAAPRTAHAQADVIFTGGSGTPLTLTLASPVTYTITGNGASAPFFVFDAVGGSALGFPAITGSITYNINGGSAQTLTSINNNAAFGAVTSDDIYTFGSLPGVTVGNIVTLTAGTLTTTGNIAGAPPANGSFTTFITDKSGTRLSPDGVSASAVGPEPGSVALALTGISVVVIGRARRGSKQAKAAKQAEQEQ